MNPRATGWTLVGAQVVCFVLLGVTSGRGDWATPAWVEVIGWLLIAAGIALGLWAANALGSALTPTPEPKRGDRLRDSGPYAFVRHPIYTAVLIGALGWTIRSGSLPTVAVMIATGAFFVVKARWEERRLAAHYPGYAAYAARTGRFLPGRSR